MMVAMDEPHVTEADVVVPAPAAPADAPTTAPEPTVPVPEGGRPVDKLHALGPALAGLCAALLLACLGLAFLLYTVTSHARAEADVRAVAGRFSLSLVTFNYKTIDADLARITKDATGSFKGQLSKALGGEVGVFRDALVKAEAQSTGRVWGTLVLGVGRREARARSFVDQTIRNKDAPDPRTVSRRIELTLVHTTGGWKVDNVDTREG
jgi:Mce-associated membrane protein